MAETRRRYDPDFRAGAVRIVTETGKSCAEVGARAIRVHDTRHTCASLLRSFGVDLSVIQAIFRHAQLSITADIYVHVSTEDQRDALRMIGNALDPEMPTS